MNKFMELHDSYELYEFARQYYLDIEKIDMKKMKFPVGVYFDEETGKPTFESVNPEEPTYKIKFINNGDVSLFAANTIEEIIEFVLRQGKKKVNSGDMVEVVNLDYVQPRNFDFFRNNFIDYEFACKFKYNGTPTLNKKYKVIINCNEVLLIQDTETEDCYIIERNGVK